MKKVILFFLAFLWIIISSHAQTTTAYQVKKGTWKLFVVYDSTYWPVSYPKNDTTFILDQDTVIKTITTIKHDTVKVVITNVVHDTMWQCGVNNQNWCPTKPVQLPNLVTIFTTQTLPTNLGNDGKGGIEVGIKFRTTVAGFVRGIRFYKVVGNTGVHVGELYDKVAGTRLAAATFANETSSGWQTVTFVTPVAVVANKTYTAACFSYSGYYTSTVNMLGSAIVNGPLSSSANGVNGDNGVFKYSAAPTFADTGFSSSNYWVDVIFSTN